MKKFPECSVYTRATSALISSSINITSFAATAFNTDALAVAVVDSVNWVVPIDDIRQYLDIKQFPDSDHGFCLLFGNVQIKI